MHLPIDFLPKKVSILGAARSGIAAAKFLHEKGVSVFISDTCSAEKLHNVLSENTCLDFQHESGGHTKRVLDADVIVVSPGVPSNLPLLLQAKAAGIAVWSEIELAYRFTKGRYLAVTGSTGKSTTVSLLGSILEAAGTTFVVAGNIGIPLISVVPALGAEALVAAEISSFQLENIDAFQPSVAVVLNLLKNHLDRYENEKAYYNAKKAIAINATKKDYVVLNAGDPLLVEWARELQQRTNVVWFGSTEFTNHGSMFGEPGRTTYEGVFFDGSALVGTIGTKHERLLDVQSMKLSGSHNYENACAAAAAAKLAGVENAAIAAGLAAFNGLEHRLEFVAKIDGVRYYNDSKSTTAESVASAVSAFDKNVYLIAGGRDKGCDFASLRDTISRHVRGIFLIGEAAPRMQREWAGCAPIIIAESLEEALDEARRAAGSGDVVVLSPGCSSFDKFRDFEHRGEVFKQLVKQLSS